MTIRHAGTGPVATPRRDEARATPVITQLNERGQAPGAPPS